MTWKNVQLPLSSDEVRQILENSSEDAVLVGGQALALWSQIYHVLPPNELSGGISADIDFIGSVSAAKTVGQALNRSGGSWKLHQVDPADATPQTAKLSLTVKDEGYKEVDFLWAIVGVNTDQMKTRAVEMRLPGLSKGVKIIHPLDLLRSRLHNLAGIPGKRDAQGVAQGRLAISVVRAFICQARNTLQERDLFPFIHINMPGAVPAEIDKAAFTGAPMSDGLSPEEKLAFERLQFVYSKGVAYGYQVGLRRRRCTGSSNWVR